MNEKKNLRIFAKNIRSKLPMPEISKKLCELIEQNKIYKKSKNVMIFYPTKSEVNLLNLLYDNKDFYLPRVNGKNLDICPYKVGDKLVKSSYGINEPLTQSIAIDELDLIILPALMVDTEGYRLGYGGGYYDRLLKNKSDDLKTITPLPSQLIVNKLPHDDYDIKTDIIIKV